MQAILRRVASVASSVYSGSAPDMAEETDDYVNSLHMTRGEVNILWKLFCVIKAMTPSKNVLKRNQIPIEALDNIISDASGKTQEWVNPIFRDVVELAGVHQALDWSTFMYLILRFCSLSKIELCQLNYFVIIKEVKSWTVDYVTCTQLAEYYEGFNDCPIEGFSSESIHFYRLERNRYDLPAYVELCHRFHQLINPLVYLQREVRQSCPMLSFWEDIDRVPWQTRRIDLDFFSVKKSYLSCGAEIARKKEEELKDIQKSASASGSGGAQSKEKQERMVSEEERRKKEKEELDKKRGLQKGPQLVAKGAKWEPTGAGTGRAFMPQDGSGSLWAKTTSMQTTGPKTAGGFPQAWEQELPWIREYIPKDYTKPLTEKNQEIAFIKTSRDRGKRTESAIDFLETSHRAPILRRPKKWGEMVPNPKQQQLQMQLQQSQANAGMPGQPTGR